MERGTRRGPPRGRRGPSGPKPVEVEVVEKSRRGVAKVEGFVVFVPGAELGQRVKVSRR